jgi:hypothetical protein
MFGVSRSYQGTQEGSALYNFIIRMSQNDANGGFDLEDGQSDSWGDDKMMQ